MVTFSNFTFSQSSLQDFLECRRRFYLRYLLKLRWPAIETEPVKEAELRMQQGVAFHKFIHQRLLKIRDDKSIPQGPLAEWWQNFSHYKKNLPGITEPDAIRFPEYSIFGSIEGYRLVAKYDLISILPDGTTIIYDWKTSHKKPKKSWLATRIQTILYPYQVFSAGQRLSPSGIIPVEKIRLIYWYPAFPEQPEEFFYSIKDYQRDKKQISDLVKLVSRLAQPASENNFPITDNLKQCAYCIYRSLCNTSVQAGSFEDSQDLEPDDGSSLLDFDQIAEVAFE